MKEWRVKTPCYILKNNREMEVKPQLIQLGFLFRKCNSILVSSCFPWASAGPKWLLCIQQLSRLFHFSCNACPFLNLMFHCYQCDTCTMQYKLNCKAGRNTGNSLTHLLYRQFLSPAGDSFQCFRVFILALISWNECFLLIDFSYYVREILVQKNKS